MTAADPGDGSAEWDAAEWGDPETDPGAVYRTADTSAVAAPSGAAQ